MNKTSFLIAILFMTAVTEVFASTFEGCMPQECTSGYRGYWNCVGGYRPACSDSVLMRTKEYPAVRIYDEDMMVKYKLGADIREIQASICMPKSCYATSMGVSCSTECVIGGTTHLSGSGQNYEIKTPAELLLLLDGRKVDYCQICMPKPKKPTFKSTTRAEKIAKIKSVCPDLAAILETLDEARSGSQDSNSHVGVAESNDGAALTLALQQYSGLAVETINLILDGIVSTPNLKSRPLSPRGDPIQTAISKVDAIYSMTVSFVDALRKIVSLESSRSFERQRDPMWHLLGALSMLQESIHSVNKQLDVSDLINDGSIVSLIASFHDFSLGFEDELSDFKATVGVLSFWQKPASVRHNFFALANALRSALHQIRVERDNILAASTTVRSTSNQRLSELSNAVTDKCLPQQIVRQFGQYKAVKGTCGKHTLVMFKSQPPKVTKDVSLINKIVSGEVDARTLDLPLCLPNCVLEDDFGKKKWDCTPFTHGCNINGPAKICKESDWSFSIKCSKSFKSFAALKKHLDSTGHPVRYCSGCHSDDYSSDDFEFK